MRVVPYNFLRNDPAQLFLLPPSLNEWLPPDDLAYFIRDIVDEIDLSAFYGAYREDGWGGAAHDPAVMVALLVYAYCLGVRSSRDIERACRLQVGFRVVCANLIPDHSTISRFRQRHQEALKTVFTASLQLSHRAGIAKVGLVALDGTKMSSPASPRKSLSQAAIAAQVEQMLKEAEAVDAEEDERLGEARGDELPPELRQREGRRERLAALKAEIEAEEQAQQAAYEKRLAERAERERRSGRKLTGKKPKPPQEHQDYRPPRRNLTDPESRMMATQSGPCQGYNLQAIVDEAQIILAVEVSNEATDARRLGPTLDALNASLRQAEIAERPHRLLADAGYATEANLVRLEKESLDAYVATRNMRREKGSRKRRPGTALGEMDRKVSEGHGREIYRRRIGMVEPVFGQIKEDRHIRRFMRRGLAAASSEWHLIAATHNLLKLFRHANLRPMPPTAPAPVTG
jgi:transposase